MNSVSRLLPLRVRTVWISDVHLGFRGCSAEMLHDFLLNVECETLYLVGDIIDIWSMKRGFFWPQAHNNVIRALLDKARQGTRVVYVPGNHDEMFRDHADTLFGNVEIVERAVHRTRDGKRLLVIHGDEFDSIVTCHPWLAKLGNYAYDWLLASNRWLNTIRRKLGLGYWSLAGFLKRKVKNAVNYISGFEDAVARDAQRRGVDGVICGHIHHAEIRRIGEIAYHNCGDWVESNTALIERFNGGIELLHWSNESQVADPVQVAGQPDPLRQTG
jgi:UDP-2,3-diacylglucosamine pyrophosphatase LpxH